jgi:hypothetical protein
LFWAAKIGLILLLSIKTLLLQAIKPIRMRKTLLLMLALLLAAGGFAQDEQKKAKKEKEIPKLR